MRKHTRDGCKYCDFHFGHTPRHFSLSLKNQSILSGFPSFFALFGLFHRHPNQMFPKSKEKYFFPRKNLHFETFTKKQACCEIFIKKAKVFNSMETQMIRGYFAGSDGKILEKKSVFFSNHGSQQQQKTQKFHQNFFSKEKAR